MACFKRIQHIVWRSESKHENAIDDQECSKKCSHNAGLPGEKPCKVDYDSTQFYFLIKNCIFLLTRSLYLVRSLSHEIDCKISPILPLWSESLLPGRVLEVRYPCDKPWASNTMPPFAFPDSTRANPFQRQHKSEYCGPICVLNYQDKRIFRRDTSSVFFLGWDQNWLVAC